MCRSSALRVSGPGLRVDLSVLVAARGAEAAAREVLRATRKGSVPPGGSQRHGFTCFKKDCTIFPYIIQYIILYSVRSHHTILYHSISYHIMSCHVMSCHVMSCHVMSCHVMSCHVMSYQIMPYHIKWSHHLISCYSLLCCTTL